LSRDLDIEHSIVQTLRDGKTSEHLKRVQLENQIVPHNFKVPMPRPQTCKLQGCMAQFEIILVPRQIIYPKYCPDHRNDHQREVFLSRLDHDLIT
tara:strand:- start:2254 stop:2538 length:285 start_codon:yes stop_codon:yes gene_type:complete